MPLPSLKAIWILAATCCLAGPAQSGQISSGGFSFSDELGGFRLIDVSGTGSRDDPFVIVEEIFDTLSAVLVIRRLPSEPGGPLWRPGDRRVHLKKVVRNLTARTWTGFDLELREVLDKPSRFEDGLSFDQIEKQPDDVTSDRFAGLNRRFEPRDSIRFEQGHVDAGELLQLVFPVADVTPVALFYLLQEPIFLSVARLRRPGAVASDLSIIPDPEDRYPNELTADVSPASIDGSANR
jgi:hypothetical protein